MTHTISNIQFKNEPISSLMKSWKYSMTVLCLLLAYLISVSSLVKSSVVNILFKNESISSITYSKHLNSDKLPLLFLLCPVWSSVLLVNESID